MKLRKILFWTHLVTGVLTMAVIFILSASGVLLMYERQMVEWYDTRDYRAAPPSPETPRLRPDELVAAVRAGQPDAAISAITLHSDREAPAVVAVGRRTFFVNPYTGYVWGEGKEGLRSFFALAMDFHRSLGLPGEGRRIGRALTGASNLLLLFIVASGFCLWWPRKQSWRTLRNVLWFRRGLPAKARDYNWHHVIGFWIWIPLFIIALSGVIFSYPWANRSLYALFGETPPVRGGPSGPTRNSGTATRGGSSGGEEGRTETADSRNQGDDGPAAGVSHRGEGDGAAPRRDSDSAVALDGLAALWARAEQQVEDWQTITVNVPAAPAKTLVFMIDQGTGGEPQRQSTLTLDVETGEVVEWAPFSILNPGRRVRRSLRFAHTGEIGGLFGQTLAGIVSAAACFMVLTGLALTWRRFFGRSAESVTGTGDGPRR